MDDLVVNPALAFQLTVRARRRSSPITSLSLRHDTDFELFDWLIGEMIEGRGGKPLSTELPEALIARAREAGILVRRCDIPAAEPTDFENLLARDRLELLPKSAHALIRPPAAKLTLNPRRWLQQDAAPDAAIAERVGWSKFCDARGAELARHQ